MSLPQSPPGPPRAWLRPRTLRRGGLALLLAFAASLAIALLSARERTRRATSQLNSAALRLDDLTDRGRADDAGRSAIAWGYAERLRLGLESPFRLIEAAARDPRLAPDQRHTVAWALLAHVLRGESHEIDPATLDGIDAESRIADGGWHLRIIERAIRAADNPRAAELALRMAYTLAATERIVDGSAAQLVANVAALVADRELARREARDVVRHAGRDPIDEVRARRARRAFYVERPTLLMIDRRVEREAIRLVATLLDSLRSERVLASNADSSPARDASEVALARRLYRAGAEATPDAPLAVTVKRYLPVIRTQVPRVDDGALARARNGEMLLAATSLREASRAERRALGRLLVSSAVSMRSVAQQSVWFPGDPAPGAAQLARSFGVTAITFDADVPAAWRPWFLLQLSEGIADLRRVFPALDLDALTIRFRLKPPADSALAMHDPRTRTLHLPVFTAGGTLTHELAHDLDRQVAVQQGHAGYRTDYVARNAGRLSKRGTSADNRVASALRALADEFADARRRSSRIERPAEIFATRVDWFVAQALASNGRSSGFLTAVQDELLTGHVVHPERLRSSGRSRSLIVALQGMTPVASFAAREDEPSVQALMRWALTAPVDRDVAAGILRGADNAWAPPRLTADASCELDEERAALVRLAAESRARGWLRLRARWMAEGRRPGWARAALGQAPWSDEGAAERVARLRDYILAELSATPVLAAGLPAYGAPIAVRAKCG